MCVQVCARKGGRFETILCRNRVKTTKHLARCSLYLKQMTTYTSQVIYFYVTGDGNGPTYWSVARRNPHLKQGWLKLHGFTTVWSTTEEKHSLTEVHPRRIQISVWSVPFISRSHTHTHTHSLNQQATRAIARLLFRQVGQTHVSEGMGAKIVISTTSLYNALELNSLQTVDGMLTQTELNCILFVFAYWAKRAAQIERLR